MVWKFNPFTMNFDLVEDDTAGNTLFEIDDNGDTMPAYSINIKDMELDASDDLELKISPAVAYIGEYCELDSNYDIMPKEVI